jgi:hypothetical protein
MMAEADAPAFDYPAAFQTLLSRYPAHRRARSAVVERLFWIALHDDPAGAAPAFARMLDNLATQITGDQWRDPRYVPTLTTWLREGRWDQRHEPAGGAVASRVPLDAPIEPWLSESWATMPAPSMAELGLAREWLRSHACPHDPICRTRIECERRLVLARRQAGR